MQIILNLIGVYLVKIDKVLTFNALKSLDSPKRRHY